MVAQDVNDFWEIGAGKALIVMVRRIDRSAGVTGRWTARDVQSAASDT